MPGTAIAGNDLFALLRSHRVADSARQTRR
jgi:hypothetical protein